MFTLALFLLVGFVNVNAEEIELQQLIDSSEDSATVVLTKDYEESITISEGKNIVIDLGGYTITNESGKHTITVMEGATLEIIDSKRIIDSNTYNWYSI
jgi:hypothetical protein